MTVSSSQFARPLIEWYERFRRDLPWRNTTDPYAIWVSEVMLQQTRVAAVIPYYERFLARFPTAGALAAAPEEDLLAVWSGLGYYSRARNMQKAARQLGAGFPSQYEAIRRLPGVGDYTAAAIGSIAFGLPHAAADGNVFRVLARYTAEPESITRIPVRRRLEALASTLLDRERPGDFNQALIELGATVCLPANPKCRQCPVSDGCRAVAAGLQDQLPVKDRTTAITEVHQELVMVEKGDALLMWQRPADERRLAGLWEFPEPAHVGQPESSGLFLGNFRHAITRFSYTVEVRLMDGTWGGTSSGVQLTWVYRDRLARLPLTAMAKKALRLYREKRTLAMTASA